MLAGLVNSYTLWNNYFINQPLLPMFQLMCPMWFTDRQDRNGRNDNNHDRWWRNVVRVFRRPNQQEVLNRGAVHQTQEGRVWHTNVPILRPSNVNLNIVEDMQLLESISANASMPGPSVEIMEELQHQRRLRRQQKRQERRQLQAGRLERRGHVERRRAGQIRVIFEEDIKLVDGSEIKVIVTKH